MYSLLVRKNLCAASRACVSALCVEIPKEYEIGLG